MYLDYINERLGKETLEISGVGFVVYTIKDNLCYIEDIFVKKELRKSGNASQLADQVVKIAKQRGCNILLGTVVPSANNSTDSLFVLLGYGFRLHKSDLNLIWFTKEI